MLQLQKTEVIRYNNDELTKAVTDSILLAKRNLRSHKIRVEFYGSFAYNKKGCDLIYNRRK